ncbi:MAG: sce7726 family protein [Lachnospiraceae bacterium]|nr:sce7726 family protein [Lachnospiraceae bacterium]
MGRSRADVVMILSDAVCGIEIKSDADTYARLSRQVRDYDQYCDCNYIVAGTRHAHHVAEHVPKWWGIITVELEGGRPDFYVLRKPKANPQVDWQKKMSLLWRPELVHIQELNQMPRYKEKSKQFVIEKILLKVPKDKLYGQISQELFERDYTQITDEIRAYKKGKRKTLR